MTIEELQAEAFLLTKENIKNYPRTTRTFREDFLSCWQNHGRDVAMLYAIPAIYYGDIPMPSEVLNG